MTSNFQFNISVAERVVIFRIIKTIKQHKGHENEMNLHKTIF